MFGRRTGLIAIIVFFSVMSFSTPVCAEEQKTEEEGVEQEYIGGGYAASGQIENVGYMPVMYDATNGLPTSEANCVLGAQDGYIWIGGYSGIIKYNGTAFERMDASDGLTSARGFFEDSKGRIWIATNDNGVVVLAGREQVRYTKSGGLSSSSVRTFAEDSEGRVYIGSTAGICYVDQNMRLHKIDDKRINEERILKLDSDVSGKVVGYTKNGAIFTITESGIGEFYKSTELGIGKITFIMPDPVTEGKVWLGTESNVVYYGDFGNDASHMEKVIVDPLEGVKWISYECGRIWILSENMVGYLDEERKYHALEDLPLNDSIEMITTDYQDNLWVASSRQGVMKIIMNNFMDYTAKAGIQDEVVNVTCLYQGMLYVGSDTGIYAISSAGKKVDNEITKYIGNARIRHMMVDSEGDLWISTFTNGLGLVCVTRNGAIQSYTLKEGMPGNEIRCAVQMSDGSIVCGTNTGLAVIKDGRVVKSYGSRDGLANTVILSVAEGLDGEIYAGTDGDGIYVLDGSDVKRLGEESGLTSDVITRIQKDESEDLYWIVTSNSIEYMEDGEIKNVSTFPYNNNFDLYPDQRGNLWVLSSQGVYCVKKEDMLSNEISEYRFYSLANGLTTLSVANSYSALDTNGDLYIAGQTGVSKVNINNFFEEIPNVFAKVGAMNCDGVEIFPDDDGVYTIPKNAERIQISTDILDYTIQNPYVHVYLEGTGDSGITDSQNNLTSLEYTELPYGKYTLHIEMLGQSRHTVLSDTTYSIVKKPRFFEIYTVRILLILLLAAVAGFSVWKIMTGTVVRKQYLAIQEARDEAERANSAKSRFLANMSHEIRTPINTILGMDEMILREDSKDVPKPYFMAVAGYALDIKSATESLLGLINDLLDISKIESGKMHLVEQEYEPEGMLRSAITMIRIRSEAKKLYFDVDIDSRLPKRLYGDQEKIKQIILNLLTNAVKYTQEGGFALKVEVIEKTELSCALRISVKDTGIGVKQEDLDTLFTAYERLDEVKNSGIQGTGLGLDISRQFVEMMDGRLWCESVYGEGSEFIMTIDQKIVDTTEIGVFHEEEDVMAKGPYVPQFVAPDADILVVDDNPMNLTVIKNLLKPTKVFVTTADSGKDCLEKLTSGSFNVVLLDHMMPEMDGIETVAKIREKYPELPVYALTANATSGGEDFYKSKGFNGYLAKPIDTVAVEHAIMRHLPEEIMMKPVVESGLDHDTELSEEAQWLNDVEGLSVSDGIRNSGGASAFIFSLNLFCDTLDDNAKVLEDALAEGDIKLYTIKVHALKSSARIIGALELSEKCQKLEDAGNRGDEKFIYANSGDMMADYRSYKEKLSKLKSAEEVPEEKKLITSEELERAFESLREAVSVMDYDEIEMMLEKLKEYRLPDSEQNQIGELEKLLKVFDWDAMEELMEK